MKDLSMLIGYSSAGAKSRIMQRSKDIHKCYDMFHF